MHRPSKKQRMGLPHVSVKDRGTQSDPVVVETWFNPTLPSDPAKVDAYLNRPRDRSIEWMDEFWDSPGRMYASARMGRPLLPTKLPEDLRQYISEFTTRPSLDIGLFPEQRRNYREVADSRLPSPTRGVPCPVCNKYYPITDLVNWRGDKTEVSTWQEYLLPPNTSLWPHERTWPRGVFACSSRCFDEVMNTYRAKVNRKAMREGSYATFTGTTLHSLDYRDYFQPPRFPSEDTELLPSRSYRKRLAESRRDAQV